MSKAENFRKNVAKCLSKYGKKKQLCEALGIHGPYLSEILQGRKRPGLDIAVRISEVLGESMDDLLKFPADFNPKNN